MTLAVFLSMACVLGFAPVVQSEEVNDKCARGQCAELTDSVGLMQKPKSNVQAAGPDAVALEEEEVTASAEGKEGGSIGFLTTRRRSTHEVGGCDSVADIGGSEWFLSCDHKNMEKGSKGWLQNCKCIEGYQQGNDHDVGSALSAIVKPHEICVPCHCINLAVPEDAYGFSIDLCPAGVAGFFPQAFAIRDEFILPTYESAQETLTWIQDEVESKKLAAKEWMNNTVTASVESFEQFRAAASGEMSEVHAAALNQVGTAVHLHSIWDVDTIISTVNDALRGIKEYILQATEKFLTNARAAWDAAKAHAAALKVAATAVAAELSTKLKNLKTIAQEAASVLMNRTTATISSICTFAGDQYNKFTDAVSGAMGFQNLDMYVHITNPTAMNGKLHGLHATLDYTPDQAANTTAEKIVLATVNLNRTENLSQWGSTRISILELLPEISLGLADILGHSLEHGLGGFLRDASTGKLKLGVTIHDLDFEFEGFNMELLTDLLLENAGRTVPVDVPLGDSFKNKAQGALDAYAYLTFQKVETVKDGSTDEINGELSEGCVHTRQALDNAALALETEVEHAEERARQAAEESNTTGSAFADALHGAGAEACKTKAYGTQWSSGVQCVFPFTYQGVTYTQCKQSNIVDSQTWCSTNVNGTGHHDEGSDDWGYCDAGCALNITEVEQLLVDTGNAVVTDANLNMTTAVNAAAAMLDDFKAETLLLLASIW